VNDAAHEGRFPTLVVRFVRRQPELSLNVLPSVCGAWKGHQVRPNHEADTWKAWNVGYWVSRFFVSFIMNL
jgi:hypothetical protein